MNYSRIFIAIENVWTRLNKKLHWNKKLPPPFAQSQGIICCFFVLCYVTMALSQGFLNGVPLLIGGNKRKNKAWRPGSYQSVQLTCKKENTKHLLYSAFKWGTHSTETETGFFQLLTATEIGCAGGKHMSVTIRSLLVGIGHGYKI